MAVRIPRLRPPDGNVTFEEARWLRVFLSTSAQGDAVVDSVNAAWILRVFSVLWWALVSGGYLIAVSRVELEENRVSNFRQSSV
jgi:hypothetical protein